MHEKLKVMSETLIYAKYPQTLLLYISFLVSRSFWNVNLSFKSKELIYLMFWNILITDNLASWWWCNVLKNQDFLFTSWTYLHFKMEGWLEEDAQTKERERCSKNQYLKITAKHLNQKERWETKEIYSYCGSCREIGRGHEYLRPYIFVKRADTR